MPVLLSIIILLCDRTLIIESIPKLGHILSDPLSNEAKMSGKDIKNMLFNFMNNSFHDSSVKEHKHLVIPSKFNLRKKTNSTSSPSFGYDFNDTNCKTVGDRIICGYDKNIGDVDNKTVDLGNGCRIRGDRLECGYSTGPFNNSRRPPANEQDIENNNHKGNNDSKNNAARSNTDTSTLGSTVTLTIMRKKNNIINSTIVIKSATSSIAKLVKNITTSLTTKPSFRSRSSTFTPPDTNKTTGTKEAVTKSNKKHCVEKNDTIFCYSIKT